jgi:uncharacterized membrane protein
MRTSAQRLFAQGLAGCGLAILYVSCYAAGGYYHLLIEPAAYVLLAGAAALAVALSLRYSSAVIAILGSIGALLAPVLLAAGGPLNMWILWPYLVAVDAAAVAIAANRGWASLVPVVGAGTLGAAWFLLDRRTLPFVLLAVTLAAVHYAALRKSGSRSEDRAVRVGCRVVIHVCTLLIGLRLLNPPAHDMHAVDNSRGAINSLFLGVYGLAAFIYGFVRTVYADRVLGLSLLALVTAKVYAWDVWQLPNLYRVLAFLALGVVLMAASWVYSRAKARTATEGNSGVD